ncbi:3'-5' exonuclease [Halomonas sp. YLGW01]|uniref:3'-5' exonuclease n=1 Tax=Halomonas sp. YLGW01 TaxID=2773308 RepID=UPI00177D9BAA|nr:3'-5' exonuclease [Halomonas sp. YLGW01]
MSTPTGLPRRQRLIGVWLLLSGLCLFGGAFLALWLDSRLAPVGAERIALWGGCLTGGGVLSLLGLLLERRLFAPLRHLQVQVARMVASPDARDDYRPEGWLTGLAPDLMRLREHWRQDRSQLAGAHAEGARGAARIRQELEALLQVLETPLLLCDRHRRLLLFNQAAESLFADHPGLGLGKRLEGLFDLASLSEALDRLPADGTPRELLVPLEDRWLHGCLRRVPNSDRETLITLTDSTAAWHCEMGTRARLAECLTAVRRHGAGLSSAAEALTHLSSPTHSATQATTPTRPPGETAPETPLSHRLAGIIDEEGQGLGQAIDRLGEALEALQRQGERLAPLWSNDLWQALNDHLASSPLVLTPIGMPAWVKADAPALLVMLEALATRLGDLAEVRHLDAEVCLGNRRVYLDLIWRGAPLTQHQLAGWKTLRLDALPLSPSIEDLLRQHASDMWSLQDADGHHARLRLPLPSVERVGAPLTRPPPRPEFHDFGIADLPPPDAELAACPLAKLEVVAFDTETTGLALRQDDRVISIGACRIVNGRLLADDTFDVRVDPGRSIPPASTAIHGLTDADVLGAPPLSQALPRFRDYLGDAVILAHNAAFDLLALQPPGAGVTLNMPVLDTLLLSRALDPAIDGHDLDSLASRYALNFAEGTRHTALGDARVTAELWLAMRTRLEARGIETLADALALQSSAFDREDASA